MQKRHKKREPEKIGNILNEILSSKGYLVAYKEDEVVRKWPEIIGEKLKDKTVCDRADNGILYVRVQSAPWRQEIASLKKNIIDKIPKITNCNTIKDIVFY